MNIPGRRKGMPQHTGRIRTWSLHFELWMYWAVVRTYNAKLFTWCLQFTEQLAVVDNGFECTGQRSLCCSLSLSLSLADMRRVWWFEIKPWKSSGGKKAGWDRDWRPHGGDRKNWSQFEWVGKLVSKFGFYLSPTVFGLQVWSHLESGLDFGLWVQPFLEVWSKKYETEIHVGL